jgi:hypothetical protein
MRGRVDMRQIHHKRCFGMLFSIAVGLMVSLTVAPARAADLELLTDEKILAAVKAKRLTRCPQTRTRPSWGEAQLHDSKLHSMTARRHSARRRHRRS